MPLIAGSVTIAPDGTAAGLGFAKQVYDVLEAGTDFQGITGPGLAAAKQQLADLANAVGTLVDHVSLFSDVTTVVDGSAGAIPWAGTGIGVAPAAVS